MKLLHNRKTLTSVIIVGALLVGFGGSFAIASIVDRDKGHENTSHGHNGTSAHPESESEHLVNTDHGGGQNVNITSDNSIKSLKADKNIDLLSDKASPGEVYLTVGQVLQFNTKDDKKHRIALGQGGTEHEHTSATNSGDFGAGEAWRVRLDNVGTYFFHDHYNPNINILVVVYQPGAKQGI